VPKLHQIREIAKEYRKVAKSALNKQFYILFKNGKIDKNYKFKIPNTLLSARYLQTLQYQVVAK